MRMIFFVHFDFTVQSHPISDIRELHGPAHEPVISIKSQPPVNYLMQMEDVARSGTPVGVLAQVVVPCVLQGFVQLLK